MAWVKALVIGMGVLLVAGFVVVAATLIGRISGAEDAAPSRTTVELGEGERLVRSEIDGQRVLFLIETQKGARVEVRDLATGALRSRFDVVGPVE